MFVLHLDHHPNTHCVSGPKAMVRVILTFVQDVRSSATRIGLRGDLDAAFQRVPYGDGLPQGLTRVFDPGLPHRPSPGNFHFFANGVFFYSLWELKCYLMDTQVSPMHPTLTLVKDITSGAIVPPVFIDQENGPQVLSAVSLTSSPMSRQFSFSSRTGYVYILYGS